MKKRILASILCAFMLTGCGAPAAEETGYLPEATEAVELALIEDEAVALSETPPALSLMLLPQRGAQVKKTAKAEIDYSNTADGYVMARVLKDTGKRWKAQVKGPSTTYTYNVVPLSDAVFPLTDGNGAYTVSLFENVKDNKYAVAASVSVNVTLKDEFAPYLYPNQYVDHAAAPNTVAKATELTQGKTTELQKVEAIYDYVVKELSYDTELARTVTSGYLPVLDTVLEKKSGICFDYAALMTGMLRSQGVPCKLVIGYAGTAYHAWINVWTEEHGWVDNVIYFNGAAWQRMDPTFASSGGNSEAIRKYIGDGSNYTAKYFY